MNGPARQPSSTSVHFYTFRINVKEQREKVHSRRENTSIKKWKKILKVIFIIFFNFFLLGHLKDQSTLRVRLPARKLFFRRKIDNFSRENMECVASPCRLICSLIFSILKFPHDFLKCLVKFSENSVFCFCPRRR